MRRDDGQSGIPRITEDVLRDSFLFDRECYDDRMENVDKGG